jgi:hypothetical protein
MRKPSYRNRACWLTAALFAVGIVTGSAHAQVSEFAETTSASTAEIASLSLSPLPSAPEPSFAMAGPARAEGAAFAAPMPIVAVSSSSEKRPEHAFWDRQNRILFAATGAAATADFFVTRANLAHGGRELNPMTRVFAGSTPALASNFALQTAGVIGVSYMFHRTGHHKLERITALVNISASTGAVAYGLTHR